MQTEWVSNIRHSCENTANTYRYRVNRILQLQKNKADKYSWEYPGGNGADYKQVSNDAKSYQVDAYPKLLAATRTAIGPNKLLSIAVPGKKGAYSFVTAPTHTDNI